MAITPLSTDEPYCSAADMLDRFDWRPIAQLMNDSNSNAVLRDVLLDETSTEGGRLKTILMDCSGELEASAMMGGKYSPTDLQALTGGSAAYLRRIVADLAIGRCYERRPMQNPWANQTLTARQLLNAIANGEAIFGTQEAVDASHLEIKRETPDQVTSRQGMVVQMEGYFGVRGDRRCQY